MEGQATRTPHSQEELRFVTALASIDRIHAGHGSFQLMGFAPPHLPKPLRSADASILSSDSTANACVCGNCLFRRFYPMGTALVVSVAPQS